MQNSQWTTYKSMNLGDTRGISVPMETVEVTVSSEGLMGPFSQAFVTEAFRINPDRAKQVAITPEEVMAYSRYLLMKRVQTVHGTCSDFRRLKVLYIPSFLQYVLSMVGLVVDREYGLKLTPVFEEECTMTLEQAIQVSEKIGSFEHDMQVVQDAMPREIHGHRDVMGSALIAGFVRSYQKVEHIAATYVTAFLDMKLKQEVNFAVLYRIQYDDLDFITAALLSQKGLF